MGKHLLKAQLVEQMPPGECLGGIFFEDSGLFDYVDIVLAINVSVEHSFECIIGFEVADFSLITLLGELGRGQLLMAII